MIGTMVDAVSAMYVGAGAWQGRRRKFSGELGRLVGVGVGLVAGLGAFKGLDTLAADGRLGFLGAFVEADRPAEAP